MSGLLVALLLAQYTPTEAQTLFREANDAYYAEDYATAKAKYLKLVEAGSGGADVLYNLGSACLALKQLGPAVLYLERARKLSGDDDIEGQLALARTLMLDRVVGSEAEAPFVQRVAAAIDVQLMSVAFLSLLYLAFILAFGASRLPQQRVVLLLVAAACFVGALGCGVTVGMHAYVTKTVQEAIVMTETTQARDFPGESARTSFEVHAGLKVRVVERSGRYARVHLPNSLEGWVDAAALESL